MPHKHPKRSGLYAYSSRRGFHYVGRLPGSVRKRIIRKKRRR